jgi:hypothetical protein
VGLAGDRGVDGGLRRELTRPKGRLSSSAAGTPSRSTALVRRRMSPHANAVTKRADMAGGRHPAATQGRKDVLEGLPAPPHSE